MTCYQRHMGWLFEAVGLPYEKEPRREVHEAILGLLGLPADAHCPEVWAALKTEYDIDASGPSAQLAADVSARLNQ